ncbi:MAG: PQQ-binding-like beta-propeller repeat protein [Acidobacteriota bacterium]
MKLLAVLFVLTGLVSAQDGGALFNELCAGCHNGQVDRAPNREALRSMPAERILNALERGAMVTIAMRRTAPERRAIAEFVAGKPLSAVSPLTPPPTAMCDAKVTSAGSSLWESWGQGLAGARFQTAAGLTAASVPKLKLKWAFAFPTDIIANGQPTLVNGRIYIGSSSGLVYSLDAASGCVHWYFQADGAVRAAVNRVPSGSGDAVVFGDSTATMYRVTNGKLDWKNKVESFPLAKIMGSPIVYESRVYVPVGSGEEGPGAVATYECCKFRGSIAALDLATGKQAWKTFMIDEEARPTKKNAAGTQLYGPSGVPVWSSLALDAKLHRLYVTTGNNYSEPTTKLSDSFVALDLDTGKIEWSRQMTLSDAYVAACRLPDKTNCPDVNGPDYDFASAPMLVNLPNGKRALVAGQKSAFVHAVDPDQQGEILWSKKIGRGGTAGGVQWGPASDGTNVYVALSDLGRIALTYSQNTDADPKVGGGLFALRLTDGKQVWYTKPAPCGKRPRCSPAQSAAVSGLPGVVFSGSVDGHMRAYATQTGRVIWDFDTIRDYQAVNGAPAHGGSIDGPGPVIGDGMVFFNSGYPTSGGQSGNVLLGFSVDGK